MAVLVSDFDTWLPEDVAPHAKDIVNMSYHLHEGCPEGNPAVYTLIQCTPLLVEKAGVAPDVTLRLTAPKQVSVQLREPPWL